MAAPTEGIFRKVALERLSSPEQLDQLVSLTSPIGWTAVLAVVAILGAAVGWSIFGVLPTSVDGAGILVSRGGHVFDAMAPSSGTLISVADLGTIVKKGDRLATLDDTALKQDLDHAEQAVREKQAELASVTENFAVQVALKHKTTAALRDNLTRIITAAEKRRIFYQGLLDKQDKIAKQGFLTQRFQEETRRSMDQADQEARGARSDILHLDAEEADLGGQRDLTVLAAQQAVNDAQRHADELRIKLGQLTQVFSPLDGVITELKTAPGSVVAPGKPILSIETAGSGLELLLYVPPEFGKKVTPGMEVRIEPATVKQEEYGTLMGKVVAVSDFPMTAEGMASVLQNPELVTRFMQQGPPYAVKVELAANPGSASGYRWSGGPGPPVKLSSGTTVRAAVTIDRRAPISLLLPLLKRQAGISP